VRKQTLGTSTISQVAPVLGEDRVTELARMLGGERLLDSTRAHARDMLQFQGS
jgi:DNA repair protein RecN (Recombination protein N)